MQNQVDSGLLRPHWFLRLAHSNWNRDLPSGCAGTQPALALEFDARAQKAAVDAESFLEKKLAEEFE
jgi:hypothetical protein